MRRLAAFLARTAARLRRSDSGLAALETAMMAPVLGLLLLGGYDVARFTGVRANVDKVGFSVADVTSQYKDLTPSLMATIFKITGTSLPTYVSGTNGVTVLTSIYLDSTKTPKVRWQCYSSTGTPWLSKIGAEGATATVPAGLLADVNDNIMISEVYYKFNPIFSTFFKNGFMLYTSSLFRPRLGTLLTKPC